MIGGRYTLREEIGRGGMGAVWLARDETLDRPVALKRLGMDTSGDEHYDLARAEREARLAAMLNHPNVVAVFDLVVDDGQRWLVMEYVPSLTLAQLVRREGPLPPDRAAALLGQAADALAAAHDAGIVHRDVKPSNILVTSSGQVKLTDFGIARAQADASLTRTGMVTGSPAYLAPEVASGRSASHASDVWSLGATLFHALAGHPPFDVGENVVGSLYRIVHEEPPRIDDQAGRLAPLLRRTMATDPRERWAMARVRDELARGGTRSGPPGFDDRPDADEDATQVYPGALAAGGVSAATGAAGADDPDGPTGPDGPQESSWAGSSSRVLADDPERPTRSRAAVVALVAAAALVLVAAIVGVTLVAGDDGDQGGPSAVGDTSQSGSESPSPSPSQSESPSGSPSRSPSPTPSPTPTPETTAAGMRTFVQDYVTTATSDTRAAYEQLTPSFQQASGGFGGYDGFWGKVDAASVSDVQADPEGKTVSYTISYSFDEGRRSTESVQLSLVGEDGSYRIAGEA